MSEQLDMSEAIELYLRLYPGKNDAEFETHFGSTRAAMMKTHAREILNEAMTIELDWTNLSLNEAGDFVEAEMRHSAGPLRAAESFDWHNRTACLEHRSNN